MLLVHKYPLGRNQEAEQNQAGAIRTLPCGRQRSGHHTELAGNPLALEYTICADKDVHIGGSANLFMVQYPDLHLLRLCAHSPDVPVTQAYARITWKPR